MDIYDYLKLDHAYVAQLFKQFKHAKLPDRKKQIVDLITQELLVHAHSEQGIFYKALKKFDSTKEEAVHGEKEHNDIEEQIKLILHSKEYGTSWINKVEKLKDIVDRHVHEEEGTIFKHAKNVLSEEEAYIIKEEIHYLKQNLLLSLKKEKSTPPKKALARTKQHTNKKKPTIKRARKV